MEKPKKTKSGRWRIRVIIGHDARGPVYRSVTAPTKAGCLEEAAHLAYAAEHGLLEAARNPKIADLPRVCDAVDKYIDLCKTLSPATVSGYEKIRRTAFPHLMQTPIADLTRDTIQEAVNIEAERVGRRGKISPKTLANEWGLISSSLNHFAGLKFEIRLPRRHRELKEYPEPSAILSAIVGTSVELPCMLAMWCGLRMSEIRGLQWRDIHPDHLTINRTIVDVGTVPTLNPTTKTDASRRRVALPDHIRHLLDATPHDSEFVITLNHSQIYGRFRRIMDSHGYDITFHDLRHYFASIGMLLHIPDAYIQREGGWSSDRVMKSVYYNTYTEAQREAQKTRDNYMLYMLKKTQKDNTPFDTPLILENSTFNRGSTPLGTTNNDDFSEDD